jgi:hypothetical protein
MTRLKVLIIVLFSFLNGYAQKLSDSPYLNSKITIIYDSYTQYNWGVAFKPLQNGYLYKVGMHISDNDTCDHIIQVWINDGLQNSLLAGPYIWISVPGFQGWDEFDFPSAIEIKANRTYIVSIINSTDLKTSNIGNFNSTSQNRPARNPQVKISNDPGIIGSIDLHVNNSVKIAVAAELTPGTIGSDQKPAIIHYQLVLNSWKHHQAAQNLISISGRFPMITLTGRI